MAILCATYGWTPDVIANLTPVQVQYFLDQVPVIEARRHYPTAKLHASVLNALGGKGDIDDHGREVKSTKPPKPEHLLYTPEELLAWYADFGDSPPRPAVLSVDAARDLLANTRNLPTWALDIAPIEEAKRVLGA